MRLTIQKSRSEESLIKGCRKQDSLSQQRIFEKYAPKMLGLCQRYISDRPSAEDVMIGAFAKVFRKISQYKGIGSFEGWIRRIMINESLIFLRRNRNMYLEVDVEDAYNTPDYNHLEGVLEAQELMNLIQELPEGYRIVFNLYAIEGYTHKEIAQELGININTSKSQLSRARKWLKCRLTALEQKEKLLQYEYGTHR